MSNSQRGAFRQNDYFWRMRVILTQIPRKRLILESVFRILPSQYLGAFAGGTGFEENGISFSAAYEGTSTSLLFLFFRLTLEPT